MAIIEFLIVELLFVIPLWAICSKVGIVPVLSLVAFIPFLGILIALAVIAFAPWPNVRVEGT